MEVFGGQDGSWLWLKVDALLIDGGHNGCCQWSEWWLTVVVEVVVGSGQSDPQNGN